MYIYHVLKSYRVSSLHKVKVAGSAYKQSDKTYYCNVLLGYKGYYTIHVDKRSYVTHLDTVHGPFDFFVVYKVQDRQRYLNRIIIESTQPDFASVVIDYPNVLVSACTYHYIPIGDYHIVILVLYYNRGAGNYGNIDSKAVGGITLLYYKGVLLAKNILNEMIRANVIADNILKVICYYITEFILPGVITPKEESVNFGYYNCRCYFWLHNYSNSTNIMLSLEGFPINTLFLHSLVPSISLYTIPVQDSLNIMCVIYHNSTILYRFIGSKQIIYDTDKSKDKVLYQKAKNSVNCINIRLKPIKTELAESLEIRYYFNFLGGINKDILYEAAVFSDSFYVLGLHKMNAQNNCYVEIESKLIEKHLFLKSKAKKHDLKISGDMSLILNRVEPYFAIDVNNTEVLVPNNVFEFRDIMYRVFIFKEKTHVDTILLHYERETLKIELKGDYGKMFLDALNYSVTSWKLPIFFRDGEKAIIVTMNNSGIVVFKLSNSVIYDVIVFEGDYELPYFIKNTLLITIRSGEKRVFYLLDAGGIVCKTDDTWIYNVFKSDYHLSIDFYPNYLLLSFSGYSKHKSLTYALVIDFNDRDEVKVMKGKVFYSDNIITIVSTLNGVVFIFDRKLIKVARLYENVSSLFVDDPAIQILSILNKVNNPKYQVDLKYNIKDDLFIMKVNDIVTMTSKVL